jgi:alpha-glucosidase (family GH31 glycosyl hydrolase)
MWACGPHVWHDNYTGSAMILDHAAQFTALQIPYSTIWLDRPYNNGAQGWSNMNFEGDFGNPEVWIKKLATDYFIHMVTWIMPGVFTGTPPKGAFTSSPNQYFDLTDQTQVDWYRNKLKVGQYPFGVTGHKLDRIDNGWSSGDLPAFKDGTPAPERHKKYAYLNCKVTSDMLTTDAQLGDDSFIFPRCAVARCQQYTSAIWNGDTYADWAGMTTSMGNAFRAGILGFPMWGSDIGGYTQKSMPSIENYCRWLSFGVYSGFMELMLDGKEPWNMSAANQAKVRTLFNQRFTLLPYIYSIINTSSETGVTMKPLVGEYPEDPQTHSIVDEYLFGPAMLVAPIFNAISTRTLYLPAGKWINAHDWSDEQMGGTSITSKTMSLTQIPVYIKVNSIFPTGQVYAGLAQKWDTAYDRKRHVVINAFPGFTGDSASFTYVDYLDSNRYKTMSVAVSADNIISVGSPALTVLCTLAVRLWERPAKVTVNSTVVNDFQYDAAGKKLVIPFSAQEAVNVQIKMSATHVKRRSIATIKQSHLGVRYSTRGAKLLIPPVAGIISKSAATIQVSDMAGRTIAQKSILVDRSEYTPVNVALCKGTYLVKLKVAGVPTGSAKIIVP